jgi:hypothetical protein
MPVEMIGWIAPRVSSEIIPPSGLPFNACSRAARFGVSEAEVFNSRRATFSLPPGVRPLAFLACRADHLEPRCSSVLRRSEIFLVGDAWG